MYTSYRSRNLHLKTSTSIGYAVYVYTSLFDARWRCHRAKSGPFLVTVKCVLLTLSSFICNFENRLRLLMGI